MKVFIFIVAGFFLAVYLLGCQSSKTRAVEGSIIGGVVGAAAGGIIGHQSGHGGEGAGIGAAVGALTGAVIGSQIDKPGQGTQPAAETKAVASEQVTVQQLVNLSKQGVSDAVIIDKIRETNSKFTLSPGDINYLKDQGVSQKVIDAMQGK